VDQRHFDRLTTALAAGTGRRRALAGLLAATAVLGRGTGTSAKKKCTHCPQFACCSCGTPQQPTKCGLIDAPNFTDAQNACVALCGTAGFNLINQKIPGFANLCNTDFTCDVQECPIKL
jgi:hypothetical protein